MALAQLVVQVPGTLIKSGDWNNEFQNILTHPIALISPTTGAINFNLQTHTNLVPTAITATSASNGQVLSVVAGAPAWTVLTPSGGLTTGTVSAGDIFRVSTSGVVQNYPIGTSGQVLMVATSGLPTWQNLTSVSGSGGSVFDPTNTMTFHEDFFADNTAVAAVGTKIFDHAWSVTGVSSGALLQPNGVLRLAAGGGGTPNLILGVNTVVSTGLDSNLIVSATQAPVLKVRWMTESTLSDGQLIVGLASTGTFTSTTVAGVGAGAVYLMATSGGGTVSLVTVTTSGQSVLSAGVTCTSFHTYQVAITTSQCTLTVDGVLVGNLTSNMPTSGLSPGAGIISTGGWRIDYINITSTTAR